MYVINDTDDALKLVLFQALDECKEVAQPGYVKDTGVFVGGVDLTWGQDCSIDPGHAGGLDASFVYGTRGRCSFKVSRPDGTEVTITCEDWTMEPDEDACNSYFPSMGWRYAYTQTSEGRGEAQAQKIPHKARRKSNPE